MDSRKALGFGNRHPGYAPPRHELLDNVKLYWLNAGCALAWVLWGNIAGRSTTETSMKFRASSLAAVRRQPIATHDADRLSLTSCSLVK